MGTFEKALRLILNWEGGYVNDSKDPGGETKYGICKRSYPTVDIKALTEEQAAAIYKKDYWDACRCGEMADPVGIMVFDSAVNQGTGAAIHMIQEAAGVMSDGVIGDKTLHAINMTDPIKLAREFCTLRALRYAKNSNFELYGKGWLRRLFDIFHYSF